jgi:hypothetical protein
LEYKEEKNKSDKRIGVEALHLRRRRRKRRIRRANISKPARVGCSLRQLSTKLAHARRPDKPLSRIASWRSTPAKDRKGPKPRKSAPTL